MLQAPVELNPRAGVTPAPQQQYQPPPGPAARVDRPQSPVRRPALVPPHDSAEAIAWLEARQHLVDLISLDHDLDSVDRDESPRRDHGCGRGVADYLAEQLPTCPIIIHTSNSIAGDGMYFGGYTMLMVRIGTLWPEAATIVERSLWT